MIKTKNQIIDYFKSGIKDSKNFKIGKQNCCKSNPVENWEVEIVKIQGSIIKKNRH